MKRLYSLTIFLFFTITYSFAYQASQLRVFGKITDKNTKEAIVGASISWNKGREGVVADVNGEFSFSIEKGSYELIISAVGKKTIKKKVKIDQSLVLNFQMKDDVQQLSEVTVRSSGDVSSLKSASMGIERLSIKSIKQIPPMMGEVDVIKSIITLPGISSVGEGSGGINVRGGSVGQNLVLLDGAPIFFTSHLFGFFSVFNQDVIDNVTLYKASVPAQYGGRISSVLSVETQNPIKDSLTVSGGVGLISSRLTLQSPIVKDKLGLLISARSTYSDWLLKVANNAQLNNSSASFYDLNSKITWRMGDKSKLSLSAYQGADEFAFSSDTTYRYGNLSSTLSYQYEFNNVFNISSLISYSNNFSNVYGNYSNQDFLLEIGSENMAGKLVVGVDLDKQYFELGLEFNKYQLNPGDLRPTNNESIISNVNLQTDNGQEWGFFIEDNFEFNKLKFIAGLRYSLFQKTGPFTSFIFEEGNTRSINTILREDLYKDGEIVISYGGFEPRFSMNYEIDNVQSLKLGYQRTRQYMHLIANNAAIVPTDVYRLSNSNIKPQIGDQISLGYFRNFNDKLFQSSFEVYYKTVQNSIDYKDGANLLLNNYIETELINGLGNSYGAEVSISKSSGDLSGRLSYTYSRSFFQSKGIYENEIINNGEAYPTYFDKPHDLTSILTYVLSDKWSLSANFTYSTGRPVSIPISRYEVGEIAIAEFSERNQYRIPDYHRLDLSLNFDSPNNNKKIQSSWTIGLYNVYGRKNPFSVFFRDQNGAPPQAYRLAILGIPFPSVTYNFKF
ncbi:TonB-dependent receptor [Marivirga arenosa]|uniref:TonB-dependent receptor n=1 Tax=Marivirga arenosa TaxID=3059076 RepID=A0AA51N547_9BACT|nr:TonB-dependent receptor [Marivirga sp. ABR2-2]WMN06164.1 TonB-dependent receptor [Marivirga sp. ABR2-2]